MNTTDKKIADTLAKFGEPMAGNVWRVQGTAVIYHKALERIAAQAKITFDEPKIIRAERDEAIIQVTGRMGDRVEWSIGEALIGVNYRVSGKQAAYVYAMAEKRAKDRVILKLIELSGDVYSEEEADEFKDAAPRGSRQAQEQDNTPSLADEMIGFIASRPSLAHLNRFLASDQFKADFATLNDPDKQRIDDAETKRRGELEAA
ncbi:trna delta -isopentenylpyrophosphate transferase [Microvirga sp. GCM10011540]|uniref:trna delta -isopentenylpyrophosphate transferase n=1 Tax=Microvirga sp. GCM10011540 TaxID=3317338 RepID=UPI0036235F72